MRGAGIVLALAKYMACPVYSPDEEWTPGAYMECEDCSLNESTCDMLTRIDEAMEVTDESEFT